jgi:hypothetical protein
MWKETIGVQGWPMQQRNIDVHFSVPKDSTAEADPDTGTPVVFNMDSFITQAIASKHVHTKSTKAGGVHIEETIAFVGMATAAAQHRRSLLSAQG